MRIHSEQHAIVLVVFFLIVTFIFPFNVKSDELKNKEKIYQFFELMESYDSEKLLNISYMPFCFDGKTNLDTKEQFIEHWDEVFFQKNIDEITVNTIEEVNIYSIGCQQFLFNAINEMQTLNQLVYIYKCSISMVGNDNERWMLLVVVEKKPGELFIAGFRD